MAGDTGDVIKQGRARDLAIGELTELPQQSVTFTELSRCGGRARLQRGDKSVYPGQRL